MGAAVSNRDFRGEAVNHPCAHSQPIPDSKSVKTGNVRLLRLLFKRLSEPSLIFKLSRPRTEPGKLDAGWGSGGGGWTARHSDVDTQPSGPVVIW